MRIKFKRFISKDGTASNIFDLGHTSVRLTDSQARELLGQMQAEKGLNGEGATYDRDRP